MGIDGKINKESDYNSALQLLDCLDIIHFYLNAKEEKDSRLLAYYLAVCSRCFQTLRKQILGKDPHRLKE